MSLIFQTMPFVSAYEEEPKYKVHSSQASTPIGLGPCRGHVHKLLALLPNSFSCERTSLDSSSASRWPNDTLVPRLSQRVMKPFHAASSRELGRLRNGVRQMMGRPEAKNLVRLTWYIAHLPLSLCQVQPVLWGDWDPGLPPWDGHPLPREWCLQETHLPTGPPTRKGAVPGLFGGERTKTKIASSFFITPHWVICHQPILCCLSLFLDIFVIMVYFLARTLRNCGSVSWLIRL